MYLGVDIGGTKTLVCVLTNEGKIVESTKFLTPKNYDHFILELAHTIHHLEHKDFKAAGVGVPGRIDREHGRVHNLGNLKWRHVPLQHDCEKIFRCPTAIENDANLAGLSEAQLHKDKPTVLYITVSTGIGTAVVQDQRLDLGMLDTEGGHVIVPFKDKLETWESFASGKAIFMHFGKKAMDITSSKDWKYIVRNLVIGMYANIAVVQPDLVIVGGSIGTYFDRYGDLLNAELQKYHLPMVPVPPVVQAQRPEEAVAYGAYELAKQTFNHA